MREKCDSCFRLECLTLLNRALTWAKEQVFNPELKRVEFNFYLISYFSHKIIAVTLSRSLVMSSSIVAWLHLGWGKNFDNFALWKKKESFDKRNFYSHITRLQQRQMLSSARLKTITFLMKICANYYSWALLCKLKWNLFVARAPDTSSSSRWLLSVVG